MVGYASKTLISAYQSYSVTELEMTGLHKNMVIWQYLYGHNEFDAAVDHQAIVAIMVAKGPIATNRMGCLLEKLCLFPFQLHYLKGKDMKISDYLSRVAIDQNSPHDLVPVAFNPHEMLMSNYSHLMDDTFEKMEMN